jgi:hypothetical protein
LVTVSSQASEKAEEHAPAGPACEGFGPQAPRDIDSRAGESPQIFSMAPSYQDMNLCNIHFHNNAEHKGKAFPIYVQGEHDHGGYQCAISKKLSAAELAPPAKEICKSLKPGDTVEVHWVHSSCQVTPGKGLGACLNDKCSNPGLRVEAQVFTLVNDPKALNFKDFDYSGKTVQGHPQADGIPKGKSALYLGSTTGPKYNDSACSPLQVTWSVRENCAKLDINSLGEWCEKNGFEEDHAHGVRKLVENPKLLSKIK